MAFVEDAILAANSTTPLSLTRPAQETLQPPHACSPGSHGRLSTTGARRLSMDRAGSGAAFVIHMPADPERYAAQLYSQLHDWIARGWIISRVPPGILAGRRSAID